MVVWSSTGKLHTGKTSGENLSLLNLWSDEAKAVELMRDLVTFECDQN